MSVLDILINDIIIKITTFLRTCDKVMFLSISKDLHFLKDKIYYDKKIRLRKICNLWYYDNFTNIIVGNTSYKYKLPKSVNHLTFYWEFNKDVKGYIPNSITHLTLGDNFNRDIKGCIPNSVTHLNLGWEFDQDIKDCI